MTLLEINFWTANQKSVAYFVCPQIVALSFKSNNRPAFGVLTGMCVCACVYVCVSMMGLSCRHSYGGYKGKTILQHTLCSKNCGINGTHMPPLNLDICICETKFLSPFFTVRKQTVFLRSPSRWIQLRIHIKIQKANSPILELSLFRLSLCYAL